MSDTKTGPHLGGPTARADAGSTAREHLLSQLFLFAGPVIAFLMAVLFVR